MSESVLSTYILFNGIFYKNEDKLFTAGIFEKFLFKEEIRANHNCLLFWDEQIKQINRQLKLFQIKKSSSTEKGGAELKRQIERSLTKNKLFKNALVNVYFFRNDSDIEYLIKEEKIILEKKSISENGLFLSMDPSHIKNISMISSYETGSKTFWDYARVDTISSREPIIQNQEGNILEVPGKNMFVVNGNNIYTPNINQGAFRSPAFPIVKEICMELKMNFIEDKKITENDLINSDEIFLVSHIKGIQWVKGLGDRRYFLNKTRQIACLFQEKIEKNL